jgi:hypothetical protein
MRVNATSRAGATVRYRVLATDPDDGTAHIAVSCTPASGSLLPLAAHARTRTTRVTCHAHDAAGNRAAPTSFAVTVVGAAGQLTALRAAVRATVLPASSKKQLLAALTLASKRLHAGNDRRATTALASFIAGVGRLDHPRPAWSRDAARVVGLLG